MEGKDIMGIKQLQEELQKLKLKTIYFDNKLKELKSKEYDLPIFINYKNSFTNELANKVNSSQEQLYNAEALLKSYYKEELKYVSNKIKNIEIESSKISKLILEKENQLKKLQNDSLCKKSLTANKKNSYFVSLKKNTNTTPVITEYFKSDKEFMILDAGMILPQNKRFSYIIVRSNKTIIEMQNNIPTMSEIKSVVGKFISSVNIPRMQYLRKHIINVTIKHKSLLQNSIIPLSQPCPIGGQANFNQTGYGWEWDWSYATGDYTEGTYYGEMTGFLVIGIQINDSVYY